MKRIKNLEIVASESTCLKRTTICEIQDKNGVVLSRESNRCNPPNGVCCRIGLMQNKANYDIISECNWTHAEIMAIRALPDGSKPYRALLYGHSFYCDACQDRLKSVGVNVFDISTKNI